MQFLVFLVGLLLMAATMFLWPLLGTLAGAFVGFVVNFFWHDTFLNILSQLGIEGVALWKFGAFLGFVAGFFKSTGTNVSSRTSTTYR